MNRCSLAFYLVLIIPSTHGQGRLQHNAVAGSEHDFMLVQHYRIQGSNKEIGQRIAQIAKSLQIETKAEADPVRNRLQYRYFKQNYPQHYERMLGVAEEYGIAMDDQAKSVSILPYLPGQPGCSVAFYSASRTVEHHNILSRNLDMPIDIGKKGSHICSRPVVFEVYPDLGYPSLYICMIDLLGGAVEGINSKGLGVAVLGDEVSNHSCHPAEPSDEVGLDELLVMRYLLDNCKNVEEAKESLLWLKQYYRQFPLHYFIADDEGRSFAFEFSRHRNQSHVVEGDGIQCITNHPLWNLDLSDAPQESIERLGILKSLTTAKEVFTMDEIKEIQSKVTPWMPDYRPRWPSSRTLWHSIYDLDSKSLKVKFYLGEMKDPRDENRVVTKYSDYREFQLNP